MKHKQIKINSLLAALALVFTLPLSVLAYTPERPTYTIETPADKITFNSIKNNPNYGDERNFVLAKPNSHTTAGGWKDTHINVDKDEEFLVRVYVHNNAAANLNLTATNTRVKVSVPTKSAKEIQLGAFISANEATPAEVGDDVIFQSDKLFNIAYVAGSARYKNNINPGAGFVISDDLVTNKGALIGYDKMDGNLKGCFEYSGVLTFKVRTSVQKSAAFTMSKQVRKAGTKEWHKQIEVKPGDKVDYQIMYSNTGETAQQKVVVKDFLPNGLSKVNKSLLLKNANYKNPIKVSNEDSLFNNKGLVIGDYAQNSNAFMMFAAEVPKNNDLKVCGKNIFRNKATIYTNAGALSDVADVIVTKTDCIPVAPTPIDPIPNSPTPEPNIPNATTPDTPEALPQTGPIEALISSVGILLVAAAVVYWYKSQQELKNRKTISTDMEVIIDKK